MNRGYFVTERTSIMALDDRMSAAGPILQLSRWRDPPVQFGSTSIYGGSTAYDDDTNLPLVRTAKRLDRVDV